MFAGAIVLFVLLCGVVVDIAYYWVGSLQAQRAADAAALAGAVYLPGDPTTAFAEPRPRRPRTASRVGGNVLAVTPTQDSTDLRQLDVAISAKVGTFFSRIVGITSWPVNVTSKGDLRPAGPDGQPRRVLRRRQLQRQPDDHETRRQGSQARRLRGPGYTSVTPSTGHVGHAEHGSLYHGGQRRRLRIRLFEDRQPGISSGRRCGLLTNLAANATITSVDRIQATLTDVSLSKSCAGTTTTISVALSGDNGNTWTTARW